MPLHPWLAEACTTSRLLTCTAICTLQLLVLLFVVQFVVKSQPSLGTLAAAKEAEWSVPWSEAEVAMHRAFGAQVKSVMSNPSSCVPNATAIISITNAHHALLTTLQFAILPPCLVARTVLYCSKSVPRDASFRDNCHWAAEDLAPSNFRAGEYEKIVWLKSRLIAQASRYGSVFWVDADVAILRNPFPLLAHVATPLAMARESRTSSSTINSGQMWIRSHALAPSHGPSGG